MGQKSRYDVLFSDFSRKNTAIILSCLHPFHTYTTTTFTTVLHTPLFSRQHQKLWPRGILIDMHIYNILTYISVHSTMYVPHMYIFSPKMQ